MTNRYHIEKALHVWEDTSCWFTVGENPDGRDPALFIHPNGLTTEMESYIILDDELIDALCEALKMVKKGAKKA